MDTKELQTRLIALGYSVGPSGADGIFGRNTIAAVRTFQKEQKLPIRWPGTVGLLTIAALRRASGDGDQLTMTDELDTPPWVELARQKIGLHEKTHNKKLSDWLRSDGHFLGDPSVLPWCGDFMETCIALTLPEEPMVTNPYWALNWTKFGVPIDIVAFGAIAPFGRNGGGHIAMIVGHDDTHFHALGGNQSNAVSIVRIAKNRLEGKLRWPKTYSTPYQVMSMTTINATVSTNEL